MTTELYAAAIVACTAIALAAVCVALAANRSGHHDRSTIDTDHARRLGLEVERHARRLAELEGRLARLQGGAVSQVATIQPTAGRHAHAGGGLVSPQPNGPSQAQGVYAPVTYPPVTSGSPNDLGEWLAMARRDQASIDRSPWANIDYDDDEPATDHPKPHGAHDAHRARHLDAGDTLRMPKRILAGGWSR